MSSRFWDSYGISELSKGTNRKQYVFKSKKYPKFAQTFLNHLWKNYEYLTIFRNNKNNFDWILKSKNFLAVYITFNSCKICDSILDRDECTLWFNFCNNYYYCHYNYVCSVCRFVCVHTSLRHYMAALEDKVIY